MFLWIYVTYLCLFMLVPLLVVIQVGFACRVLILMEQVSLPYLSLREFSNFKFNCFQGKNANENSRICVSSRLKNFNRRK